MQAPTEFCRRFQPSVAPGCFCLRSAVGPQCPRAEPVPLGRAEPSPGWAVLEPGTPALSRRSPPVASSSGPGTAPRPPSVPPLTPTPPRYRPGTAPAPTPPRHQPRHRPGTARGAGPAGRGAERSGENRTGATMMCGAPSAARPATEETQRIAEQVKAQLEEKEGKTFDVFTAVEFKTQLVAGTNYFIKVHVGNDEFMHLRVFKSLPHENEQLSLHSYQGSKTKHDDLAYF